jgi:predicted dehydrogenase
VTDPVAAGVVGVGSMGANHARVYHECNDVDLIGVADADADTAESVARRYDTRPRRVTTLVDAADVVSVAVPTRHHARVVRQALEADADVLVEKPFVREVQRGRELAALARERDAVLQVGHIERFNPAVRTLFDLVSDLDVVSVRADRVGPPVDRDFRDDVVMDLMIHDIDVVLSLVDGGVETVSAAGTAEGQYSTAQLTFDSGVVGTLTASRVNQKRARKLTVVAADQLVEVDYFDQSLRIHRQSEPSYEATNGDFRYQQKRVTEQPLVDTREPLKCELEAFVEAARDGTDPEVTPAEALRAVEMAHTIGERAGLRADATAAAGSGGGSS